MAIPSPGSDPSSYRIGEKVRRLRLGRSMGLVEVGRHTGLSASLLSKLETGKSLPTLLTLQRVATVFSVGLDHFFSAEDGAPTCSVVRRSERLRLPSDPLAESPSYWFESLDFSAVNRPMSAYLADVEAESAGRDTAHEHPGVELIYVIKGVLGLWHDGSELRLETGDSVYFDASIAHGYRRFGRGPCRIHVVTVP